jgi:hypothetical protein
MPRGWDATQGRFRLFLPRTTTQCLAFLSSTGVTPWEPPQNIPPLYLKIQSRSATCTQENCLVYDGNGPGAVLNQELGV